MTSPLSASGTYARRSKVSAIGAGDEVVATGRAQDVEGGRLIVDLKGKLPPGAYRVLLALALNGNSTNAEVKVISYRVAE